MELIALPKLLRALLALLAIRAFTWLILDVIQLLGGHSTALVLGEAAFELGLLFFTAGAFMGSPISVRIFSWIGRIWGILSIIGTAGIVLSARLRVAAWQQIEMGSLACLHVVVGFWLAAAWKSWIRNASATRGEFEASAPFVGYKRR